MILFMSRALSKSYEIQDIINARWQTQATSQRRALVDRAKEWGLCGVNGSFEVTFISLFTWLASFVECPTITSFWIPTDRRAKPHFGAAGNGAVRMQLSTNATNIANATAEWCYQTSVIIISYIG